MKNIFKSKILAIIPTIILLAWTIIQIIDWVNNNRSKITATIEIQDFYLPSDYVDNLSLFKSADYANEIIDCIEEIEPKFEGERIYDTLYNFISNFSNHPFFKDYQIDHTYFSAKHNDFKQVILDIKCKSKETVKNLNIDTETSGYYQLITQNEEIITGPYDHNIKLEDIRPENEIKVILWTRSLYSDDKFKINYDGGYIKPAEILSLSGIYVWLYNSRYFP